MTKDRLLRKNIAKTKWRPTFNPNNVSINSRVAEGGTLQMGISNFLRIIDACYVSIDMSKHARLAPSSIFNYH